MAILDGMKAIANYINRTEATTIKYIKDMGMPARKLDGSTWMSDSDMIDDWRRCQIAGIAYDPRPQKKR